MFPILPLKFCVNACYLVSVARHFSTNILWAAKKNSWRTEKIKQNILKKMEEFFLSLFWFCCDWILMRERIMNGIEICCWLALELAERYVQCACCCESVNMLNYTLIMQFECRLLRWKCEHFPRISPQHDKWMYEWRLEAGGKDATMAARKLYEAFVNNFFLVPFVFMLSPSYEQRATRKKNSQLVDVH